MHCVVSLQQKSNVHLVVWSRDRTRIVELTGQGYHQINWDNPGYPGLVTFGPERVGAGGTPTGEHIGLIFVQCWEKTSLHSLGHRHGTSGP